MNYDQPRQLANKSGWHYTRMNDGQVWAIGYCRQHLDQPHATEQEARDCYTSYLLNERLNLDGRYGNHHVWYECRADGCKTLTQRYAQVNGRETFDLCDEHRTREQVVRLFGQVGDSVRS